MPKILQTAEDHGFMIEAIDKPDDPVTLLVWADWLDDRGRVDEGFALRWMAATGHRPLDRTNRYPRSNVRWGWLVGPEPSPSILIAPEVRRAMIPRIVMHAIPQGEVKLLRGHAYYPAWDLAVADLRRGLSNLRHIIGIVR